MKQTVKISFILLLFFPPLFAQQQQWQNISDGLPDSAIVSAITHYGKNMYVGISRLIGNSIYIPGGMYVSTNGGGTWIDRSFSKHGDIMPVTSFLSVGDTLFAGIPGGGIFKTTNEGLAWEESDNGIFGNGFQIFDLLQVENLLFAATQNGVYVSSDYGHNWNHKSSGLPLNYDSLPFQVKSIAWAGNKLYAGVDAAFQMKGGLFVSTDKGDTWTTVFLNYRYNGVDLSTDVESIEYFNGFLYIFFNGFWILKSADEGKTWSDDGSGGSAWIFAQNGKTFLRSSISDVFLFRSPAAWSNITHNLPHDILSLHIVDSLLYAGIKYNGIWKASLSSVTTAVLDKPAVQQLHGFDLDQNYPNPFNPATTIVFHLPATSSVRVEISDILGRTIVTLVNGSQEKGTHHVLWNARDAQGMEVPGGVYFYSIVGDAFRQTKKMLYVK